MTILINVGSLDFEDERDWHRFLSPLKKKGMNSILDLLLKGGPGSGNFGHEGRPGQVGGSGEGGSSSSSSSSSSSVRDKARSSSYAPKLREAPSGNLPSNPDEADWSEGALVIHHASFSENENSIHEKGLLAGRGTTNNPQGFRSEHSAVYSHPSRAEALRDAKALGGDGMIVTAVIPLKSAKDFLVPDEDVGSVKDFKTVGSLLDSGSFGYSGDIPKQYVYSTERIGRRGERGRRSFGESSDKLRDREVINGGFRKRETLSKILKQLKKKSSEDKK